MRKALHLIVALGVSLGCFYWATRGADWGRIGAALVGARPGWAVAVVLAGILGVYLRAQRWRVLLRPFADVPLYPALSATAIGFGASCVLPFRAGEFVRPALLGRRSGVGVGAAFSTIVLERLFDMLLVISCLLLLSVTYAIPAYLRHGAWALGALALLALGILLVMHRHRPTAEVWLERVLGVVPARVGDAIRTVVHSFLDGLAGLHDRPTVVAVLVYSVYVWGMVAVTFLLGFLALGIEVPLVPAALATVVIVAAAVFLPQAPAFIGTWQAGCLLALGLFGVPPDLAISYSFLTWIAQVAVNVGLGGFFLSREDFSVGQIVRLASEESAGAK